MLISDTAASSSYGYNIPVGQAQESNYRVYQQSFPVGSINGPNYPGQAHVPGSLPTASTYSLDWSAMDSDYYCPRSYAGVDVLGSLAPVDNSYPPSAYEKQSNVPVSFAQPSSHPHASMSGPYDDYNLSDNTYMHYGDQYPISHPVSRYPSPTMVSPMPHSSGPGSPADGRTPEDYKLDLLDEQNADKEEPYAKLIFRCLLGAKDHTMVLRDIYNWFNDNTDKGRDKDARGWQNSIRHNLSMNAVSNCTTLFNSPSAVLLPTY